jgi:type IV fimbrial biogenesis protein FimT
MRRAAGLTLVELLIAIGIVAMLTTLVTPLSRRLLLDARMTATVNALVHAVHLARQRAQEDLRDVVICRSVDALQCAPPGNWASGWIAFINRDRDDPPAVDHGETVLHVTQSQQLRFIISNRRAYVLRPYALRATNGTIVFCDDRGAAAARAVIVSYTGRPRVASRTASGGMLSCPA